MNPFILSTDSTADLPKEYLTDNGIAVNPLYYTIDGKTYGGANDLDLGVFYNMMRNDSKTSTNASIIGEIMENFKAILDQGNDILHIAFSSGLSSTYANTVLAAKELSETYPDRKIIVVDSLCASLGQGLLVHQAQKLKKAGKSMEEIAEWLEAHKLEICHQFTVDDLKYLQRGGRISKATQIIGTLAGIRPVLHVDNEGHLVSLSNVRGRKKSLIALVDNMGTAIEGYDNDCVFISHGDCLEDAQFVGKLVTERFGITDIMYSYVSPTIGSHSGPGTVALFHLGSHR